MKKLTFRKNYLLLTILIFFTELVIAFWVRDKIIRPYGGDVLVAVLIYTFLLTFFRWDWLKTAIGVLIFSFLVELSQYFGLIYALGLENELWAKLVLGMSYHWLDLVSYALGVLLVVWVEWWRRKS